MMSCDFLFAEAQKAGGIVVKDIAFLLFAQKASIHNRVDTFAKVPEAYIRTVHDSVSISCFDDPSEIAVVLLTGNSDSKVTEVHVDVRVVSEDRE